MIELNENLAKLANVIGRKKAASMMKILGIISTAPKPGTSIPAKQHKIYPYLLKDKVINRPNQVWVAHITYVPMEKGFDYLVAIMCSSRAPI